MKELIETLLQKLGEDPKREGLRDTPSRVEESLKFLTQGYRDDGLEPFSHAIFKAESHDMILVKDIEIYSLCEHHILPFFGKCHIGYIPNGKIIGVSKLGRITDHFSRRLQVQERLTNQISETIMQSLNPYGVGVVIEAQHFCMMMRGIQKQNSRMITSAMKGCFEKSQKTREEFLKLIFH